MSSQVLIFLKIVLGSFGKVLQQHTNNLAPSQGCDQCQQEQVISDASYC